jgi:hypothetical protein
MMLSVENGEPSTPTNSDSLSAIPTSRLHLLPKRKLLLPILYSSRQSLEIP